MPPKLLDVWQKLKAQADGADSLVLERIANAYMSGAVRVDAQTTALIEQIEAMQKSGTVTSAQIKQTAAYKNLIATVTRELDDYSAYMRTELSVAVTESAKRGMFAGNALLLAAVAASLGVEVKDVPKGTILTSNDKSLDFLAKYLDPDGALFGKIYNLSGFYADEIASGILERVGQGLNPRVIANWISDEYGYPLTDAMRQMRTSQLYSYREANAATQRENADVLQGVVWCAELDDRTCDSCLSMHGQVFPVGSEANDHHNGRCAMLPWVNGAENPIEQTGEDWFKSQDEATQRNVMGDAKFEAWNDGKFEFSALSHEYENDVFGTMRGSTPLKDLIGE